MASLDERYEAAMVLAGVGDSLGYKNGSWEFCFSGDSIYKELKSLGGLEKISVKLPGWMVSDDTVMLLATGEALADCSGDENREELFLRLAQGYKDCMKDMAGRAPGNTCMSMTHKLRPLIEKGYQIPFNPRGGGCGAAMRSMCIGLRYPRAQDLKDLVAVSVEAGRMTHHHPNGYLGSLASAFFASLALQGKPLREWGRCLLDTLPLALSYVEESGHCVNENKEAWTYFTKSWTDYLTTRNIVDGKSDAVFPEPYGFPERDSFYKKISFSGWGGSSGHDAPMIAYQLLDIYEMKNRMKTRTTMEHCHMNCYFKLASQFRTQDEPAYCGLSTLIMVLNSLEIDPGRVWKGPWKWYHEDMLDCCISIEIIRKNGITFEEFVCLAECNSLDCHAIRVDKSSREEDFRNLVQSITQKDDKVLVASYSRFVMGQTGDGHFSTIAGYHPDKDLVLILDVARFKYPPHWVPVPLLFQAMKAWDKVTGKPRGYIELWPAENRKTLLLFKAAEWFSVNVCRENLKSYQNFSLAWMELMTSASHDDADLSSLLSQVVQGLVKIARTFDKMVVLTTQEHVTCTNTCNLQCVIKKLLSQLEATTMFQIVCKETSEMSVEDVSLLEKLFGSWPTVCSSVRDTLQEVKAESRKMPCDMNRCLCLSHLITAFFLSWPYSSTPAAHTVECLLRDFSKEIQNYSHGQLLKDEMSTLSRQLEKLSTYHTVSVPSCKDTGCECKCKKQT